MRGVYGKGRPKLSDEDVLFVLIALRTGWYSKAAIGRFVSVSVKTVYDIEQKYKENT